MNSDFKDTALAALDMVTDRAELDQVIARGKNKSAVNTKTGIERLHVTIRKPRLMTRRLRRIRGTSTGSPVRSRAPCR